MGKLRSLSLFVGTGNCNANCRHCAGVPLRRDAPTEDGVIDEDLIYRTAKECYSCGARALSISSSGEPTLSPLSVTRTLRLVDRCRGEGISFYPINLYSNGIRIGEDEEFCRQYLGLWKSLGLTRIYITVHNVDEEKNALVYRVKGYPLFLDVVSRIHDYSLLTRANMVLSKSTVGSFDEFVFSVEKLFRFGFDFVSAWPIRTLDDKVDNKNGLSEEELSRIEEWVENRGDSRIRLLLEKSKVAYEYGEKLTLFPNGMLSNSWCN